MVEDEVEVFHLTATDARRGAENFAFELVKALDAIGGFRQELRAVRASDDSITLPIPTLGDARRFGPRTVLRARRLHRRADVAIGHGSSSLPVLAASSFLGAGVPFIYRGIGEPDFWASSAARRRRVRWGLRRAAAVTAIWSGTADTLVREFGVPSSKIEVLPRGIRSEDFPLVTDQERLEARRRFDVDDRLVLAFVGALSPEKRIDRAIATGAMVADSVLLVAGDGSTRSAAEAQASQLGADVRFLGTVDDVRSVYAVADLLLLTSDTEGIPGVIVEAAFCGIPTVATDAGGTVDVVEEGVTGAIATDREPATLAALVTEVASARLEMGAAARRRCLDRYDLSVVAARWAALLHRTAALL